MHFLLTKKKRKEIDVNEAHSISCVIKKYLCVGEWGAVKEVCRDIGLTFSWVVFIPVIIVFLKKNDDERSPERMELSLAQWASLLTDPQQVHQKVSCRMHFDFHGVVFSQFLLPFSVSSFEWNENVLEMKLCMFFCTFYSGDFQPKMNFSWW